MIEPWSEADRTAALAIFRKITNNNHAWLTESRTGKTPASYPMPHDIYEAHRLTMKSVSSEIGIFNEHEHILLTLRPSAEEDPAEPYPNLWHIPGTRHIANETNDDALQRLLKNEIGAKFEVCFAGSKEYPTNGHNGLSLLYVARVPSDIVMIDEKRQWFDTAMLPEPMLREHVAIANYLAERLVRLFHTGDSTPPSLLLS